MTLRVGIDVTELRAGAVGGVPRAIRLLLEALRDHAPRLIPVAFSPHPVETPPDLRIHLTGGPACPRRWRRSRVLRDALRRVDLFHSPVTAFPRGAGCPVTATVHELPFVSDRKAEGFLRAQAQWIWFSRALSECRALFTPSRASLLQMEALHAAAPERTHVVPHPAPRAESRPPEPDEGYVLFCGRLERRKRVEALYGLDAEVRIAGPEAPRGAPARVRYLGPLDDAALDAQMRRARVVALPSSSEGFGFPVLEALARGVPAIARAGTGAAETGGDACLRFEREEELPALIARAGDPAFRARLAWAGPARAAEFSPARAARAYEEAFLAAAGLER
ncbi:MAG: glycosyltransferase [Planctomycetaceae bacterium]